MSNIKIQGNASGTGTVTLAAPNTNTDRTLTLPDGAGEILTDATGLTSSSAIGVQAAESIPMFVANGADASVSMAPTTWTLAPFTTENIDTHGWYDAANAKFTPQVAGYYLFTVNIGFQRVAADQRFIAALGVNGSGGASGHRFFDVRHSMLDHYHHGGSFVTYLNGSTDYVQIFGWRLDSGNMFLNDGSQFSGTLLRAT